MWKKGYMEIKYLKLDTKTETRRTPEQKQEEITNKSEETRRNNKSETNT